MPKNTLAETIGKSIVHYRKQLDLSQKELAAKLCITHDSMSRIERGIVSPKMERLQDIANALQCSVSSLFQVASPSIQERALAIAETLESLSPKEQEAVLNVMYSTVKALKR